jgi:hypothetical protein
MTPFFFFSIFYNSLDLYIELCRGEVQESLNDIVLRLYSPYISAYITQNSPAGENPEHLTSVFFVYFFFNYYYYRANT